MVGEKGKGGRGEKRNAEENMREYGGNDTEVH